MNRFASFDLNILLYSILLCESILYNIKLCLSQSQSKVCIAAEVVGPSLEWLNVPSTALKTSSITTAIAGVEGRPVNMHRSRSHPGFRVGEISYCVALITEHHVRKELYPTSIHRGMWLNPHANALYTPFTPHFYPTHTPLLPHLYPTYTLRQVLVDVNWRPVFFVDAQAAPGLIKPYVERADIVKLTDEEAEWLWGIPAFEALHSPEKVRRNPSSFEVWPASCSANGRVDVPPLQFVIGLFAATSGQSRGLESDSVRAIIYGLVGTLRNSSSVNYCCQLSVNQQESQCVREGLQVSAEYGTTRVAMHSSNVQRLEPASLCDVERSSLSDRQCCLLVNQYPS